MMMRALEAGGMKACYKQSRDVMKAHYADEQYDPNIGGLYELERSDYQESDFPRAYTGKLIKALRLGPASMRTVESGIKVIWMHRDPEEQRQSYMAFFGGPTPSVETIKAQVVRGLEAARNRRDTDVLELWFPEIIAHPLACFETVRQFFGCDLDVLAAAEIVNPDYYRYRLADLAWGII
jgi:hypothetical protein